MDAVIQTATGGLSSTSAMQHGNTGWRWTASLCFDIGLMAQRRNSLSVLTSIELRGDMADAASVENRAKRVGCRAAAEKPS